MLILKLLPPSTQVLTMLRRSRKVMHPRCRSGFGSPGPPRCEDQLVVSGSPLRTGQSACVSPDTPASRFTQASLFKCRSHML
jgi:hypothetical protein